jgi:hypothetical protein
MFLIAARLQKDINRNSHNIVQEECWRKPQKEPSMRI